MKCLYAGSFDPPTNGHLWMIKKGIDLFGEIMIVVGENPEKNPLFSIKERVEMLKKITEGMNVKVESFENKFLINYAKEIGANIIIRGIRSEEDYVNERLWRHRNSNMDKEITTAFLIPPRDLEDITSSFVKGLIGPEKWEDEVKKYVPEDVFNFIIEKKS